MRCEGVARTDASREVTWASMAACVAAIKEVEEERDRLHQIFLRIGDAVVSRLVDDDAGFWADFVDPVGGKPHRSAYCNDNLFEIDPRLRPFGVKVEDLGCCKCVRLEKFGSKAFVGCVFTDAPFDAPVWQELLG